jgi:hypothetical protein
MWLFKSIHKHLEFHGKDQDEVWRKWSESCFQSHIEESLQHANGLVEALEQCTPGGSGLTRLLQVTGWLGENRELFAEAPPRAEQAQEEERAPGVEEESSTVLDEETEDEDDEVVEVRREALGVPRVRSAPSPELEHSPALDQLLRKLDAFDMLVECEDFSRASLVASDVLHVIEHFDPLVYLP